MGEGGRKGRFIGGRNRDREEESDPKVFADLERRCWTRLNGGYKEGGELGNFPSKKLHQYEHYQYGGGISSARESGSLTADVSQAALDWVEGGEREPQKSGLRKRR